MPSNRQFQVMGKKMLEDHRVKGGVRISPGTSAKNRAIGECARGESLEKRKECFKTHKGVKNASGTKNKK